MEDKKEQQHHLRICENSLPASGTYMSQANLITSGIEGAIRPAVTYRNHNERHEKLSTQTEGVLAEETSTTYYSLCTLARVMQR